MTRRGISRRSAAEGAPHLLLVIWMVVSVDVLQRLNSHAEIACCLPQIDAVLHEPRRRRVTQRVRNNINQQGQLRPLQSPTTGAVWPPRSPDSARHEALRLPYRSYAICAGVPAASKGSRLVGDPSSSGAPLLRVCKEYPCRDRPSPELIGGSHESPRIACERVPVAANRPR